MRKKAFQIMIETYVVIILAILVAVVLIIFWDMQTGRFSSFMKDLMGRSNVDSITAVCNNLVAREAKYEYCCSEKTVKYEIDREVTEEPMTCEELASKPFGERVEKLNCKNAGC